MFFILNLYKLFKSCYPFLVLLVIVQDNSDTLLDICIYKYDIVSALIIIICCNSGEMNGSDSVIITISMCSN